MKQQRKEGKYHSNPRCRRFSPSLNYRSPNAYIVTVACTQYSSRRDKFFIEMLQTLTDINISNFKNSKDLLKDVHA